jgi:hypothetical protein
MARLPSLTCPGCNETILSDEYVPNASGGAERASTFQSCLRRCVACGFGFSNTTNTPKVVLIYQSPTLGVPKEVRKGLTETLGRALNVQNRAGKYKSLCSHNSEDAVTWTVFAELIPSGRLLQIFQTLGCLAVNAVHEPKVLLWGVPLPIDDPDTGSIRSRLIEISKSLRENPQSRTEPDVILDFRAAGVIFVEVKHRSRNDLMPANYHGWSRYLQSAPAFRDPDGVRQTGLYELARNWRFAWELAENRPFTLVNLGPTKLLEGPELDAFANCLSAESNGQFKKIPWFRLREVMAPEPDWLSKFLKLRAVS